jgi:hypothetical protein
MRKKRKRISSIELEAGSLTEDRYDNLTSEMEVILDGDIFPSPEDRKKCYQANKKEIMERWLSDPQHFCQRPFCFWQFESLPERKVIGKQKWWNPIDHSPGKWEVVDIKEKDHQFLYRLGLLTEKEMKTYRNLEEYFQEEKARLREIGLLVEI